MGFYANLSYFGDEDMGPGADKALAPTSLLAAGVSSPTADAYTAPPMVTASGQVWTAGSPYSPGPQSQQQSSGGGWLSFMNVFGHRAQAAVPVFTPPPLDNTLAYVGVGVGILVLGALAFALKES